MEKIRREQAIQIAGWGGLYNPDARYAETDAAIGLMQQQLERLRAGGAQSSPTYQRTQFDLMMALRDRQRMPEVIAIYEDLAARDVAMPDYALLAAGDAYMVERQPEKARDIYSQILEHSPDYFDAQMALFYAYFDCGEYSKALTLIDRLAAEAVDNDRKLRTASRAAMARAWTGQLAEAQQRYESLVEQAPNNPYLRAELGNVYLWRGWPRRAENEFRLSRSIEPAVLDAHIGEIGAQRSLNEFEEAEAGVIGLTKRFPHNRQVQKLVRERDIHNMRELLVQISRSANTAPQVATNDLALDAWLYSQPLEDNYRVFAHSHYANSRFPEGTGIYRRLGAGVEYRIRDYELTGELSTGYAQDAGLGLNLRGSWMPDDFLTLGAHVDTYSNEVPLRGRLNEDIDGWSIGLNADYSFHESRALAFAMQRLEFSDNNSRNMASAVGFQRLVTGPIYKLDGRLGFYWSSNTRDDAPYYNPDSDLATEISLTNEWLVFRRYSRSFVHRLGLSIGNYRQSGFGANGTWGIDYEHEWNLDDRTYLLYGIASSRPVYDGNSETSMRYYLTLDWRF
jgi:biofilm PGA synthesis protein PgaA